MLSVGSVILLFVAVEWMSGTRHFDFVIGDTYEVNLVADKCTFCLLYEPYNYHIKITDIKTGRHHRFNFRTDKGPYLQFGISEKRPQFVMVQGDSSNSGQIWLVDMNAETITDTKSLDSIDCYPTHALSKEKNELVLKNIHH